MTRIVLSFAVSALMAAVVPNVSAATYRFVSEVDAYSILPAATQQVRVYLQESAGGSAPSLTSEGGLFSFGIRVSTVDLLAPAITDIAVAPAFNGTVTRSVATGSIVADHADFTGELPDSGRVLLATYSLNGLTPGTYNFAIRDNDPAPSVTNTITLNASDLDALVANGTFAVTVVPEPAVMSLIGLTAFALGRRRRNG